MRFVFVALIGVLALADGGRWGDPVGRFFLSAIPPIATDFRGAAK